MGRLREFYKGWHKHRAKVDWSAAGAGVGVSLPLWYEIFSQGRITSTDSAASAVAQLAAPGIAAVLTPVARAALGFFVDDEAGNRAVVRKLRNDLARETPPLSNGAQANSVQRCWSDIAHSLHHLDDDEADSFWARAAKAKNPFLAIKASWRYLNNNQADMALNCVREALDWTGGGVVPVPYSSYPVQGVIRVAETISQAMFPASVRNYLGLAGIYALTNPEKAWFYSELGRRIAKETGHVQQKEAYVFHALLSSAQHRSDEQSAWRDALQLLMDDSPVESASERESRSEVFRFNGDFFANTLVVKRRPDLASLVREYDWQLRGKSVATVCDVPEPVYVSRTDDGLSCFAMRYRNGEVVYDLLEKGDKSSVAGVAGALGEIHARVSHEGLNRVEIWKKARDKLYDSLLGIPKDLANTILAHYGPIEKGCWLAPAVINKDAHPEQWIVGDRLTAIDWEIDALVPLTFDSANFTSYRDFFSPLEQKEFVGSHVAAYKQNGGDMRGEDVFTSFYNAVIHRMVCFIGAWSAPTRKRMRVYRGEAIERAIGAIDELEGASPKFYAEYKGDYVMLRKSFTKVVDLLVP